MSNIVVAEVTNELPLTEEQMIQLWIISKKSNHTKNQYLRYINEFREVVRRPLTSIKGKMIEIYLQHLNQTGKYRPATIALRLAAIKSFYRYLLKSEIINYNPSDTVQMDNIRENTTNKNIKNIRLKSISPFEIDSLINKLEGLDKLIVATLYFTGCRVSELIDIKLEDFSFKEGQLGERKKTRVAKLTGLKLRLGSKELLGCATR